jgi:hypothetical protein
MVEWLNNDQKEQEAITAYFKVLEQYLPRSGDGHEKLQSG